MKYSTVTVARPNSPAGLVRRRSIIIDSAMSRPAATAVTTTTVVSAADPAEQGRDVRVREVLDQASQRISGEFDDRPLVEARLRETMAATYRALGLADHAE